MFKYNNVDKCIMTVGSNGEKNTFGNRLLQYIIFLQLDDNFRNM